MDIPIQNSSNTTCGFLIFSVSFKKSCIFLLILVLIIILLTGALTLLIIFALKPQKPIFLLQTVNLDSYKLDVYSNSTLFVSSVVSLSLNAQNPNKVGIRYSRSRLHVLDEGLVIGLIRVPEFYQPARSTNVSVPMRALFHCVNASKILNSVSAVSSQHGDNSGHSIIRILGDIKAYVHLFHIILPKLKVALDCKINVEDRYLTYSNAMSTTRTVKTQLTSSPVNSQTFSSNCSIAFYI